MTADEAKNSADRGSSFSVEVKPILKMFPTMEYGKVRRQILEIMSRVIPPGAAVLVASKGDYVLLESQQRHACHFPLAETGDYAGHSFPDSVTLLAHLEQLRRQGAQYFVLPETAYWWLDYYKEFQAYLSSTCRQLTGQDHSCMIFELPKNGPALPDRLPRSAASFRPNWSRLLELVRLVIPAASSVLVADDGDGELQGIEGRHVRPFPSSQPRAAAECPFPDSATGIAELEKCRRDGAQYLILPESVVWWLERYPEVRDYLESRGSAVAIEAGAGIVYALSRVRLLPQSRPRRVTAIMSVHNEERCIAACLEHYIRQGAQVYLIDNGSTDRTVAIADRYRGRGVVEIEHFPFDGIFRLHRINRRKEEIAAVLDTDWIIYTDADEFRFAHRSDWTLAQALAAAEAAGYNAVNFLEFVFIPTRESPDHDHPRFQETMQSYYFFLPRLPWRISAWQKQKERVRITPHRTSFPGLRLCPQFFGMRHYQFLSVSSAARKYGSRLHDPGQLASGHHEGPQGWREQYRGWPFPLPSASELKTSRGDQWDLSTPRTRDYLAEAVGAVKS